VSYFKIGFRYLARRKFRTILTILAIALGVSIFMGTLVASDSIQFSLDYQVMKQFGYTDILIVDEASPNSNSIPLASIKQELENISGIQFEWTYQMRQGRPVTPYKNIPTSSSYWWPIVGINASNALESKFGAVTINSTINASLITLEELLTYPLVANSCVVTQYVADLCNLTVGKSLYIYPSAPWGGINWINSSTWINLTVVGIIEDKGKSFNWFSPPFTEIWEVLPPEYAVYVHLETAQKYIFNDHPDEINLILIHASSLHAIDATINTILSAFNISSDSEINSTQFYGFNLKSFFEDQIGGMFNTFTVILAIFSGISLLICAILIKNLFEVTKEEQMEEIGIMRAIGISKIGIFRIYLSQILIIALIGSVLGLLLGYLISNIFLGPLKIISLSITPQIFSIVGDEFEIFIYLTPISLLVSSLVGLGISIFFGMIPAISACNVNILRSLNPRLREEP